MVHSEPFISPPGIFAEYLTRPALTKCPRGVASGCFAMGKRKENIMCDIYMTKTEARRFILYKQGLSH